jgi:hypothetical protein
MFIAATLKFEFRRFTNLPYAVPTGLNGLSDEDYAKKVFYVWFDACSMSCLPLEYDAANLSSWVPLDY